MNTYPQCLVDELAKYGEQPTFDLDWDRAVLHMLRNRQTQLADSFLELSPIIAQCQQECERERQRFPDLSDPTVFEAHGQLLLHIANNIVLAPQRRPFVVDDDNSLAIRFLLYYFNQCPLAESVFPDRHYKLHKNILLQGGVGVGKTMLMQVFSEYLRLTKNPMFFYNLSVTQMVNHFSMHNNIDLYTYNEDGCTGFRINPMHLCLNDIGVDNRPFYGIDTLTVVNDFLHARNELWTNAAITDRKFAHLTTNLTNDQLREKFSSRDAFNRIIDRFKTYNIIPITGESRR